MISPEPSGNISDQSCPNCGFPYQEGAIICNACGVNIENYLIHQEVLEGELKVSEDEQQQIIQTNLNQHEEQISSEVKSSFKRQLLSLIGSLAVIAIVILLGDYGVREWQEFNQNKAETYLLYSQRCFDQQDYRCAIDYAEKNMRLTKEHFTASIIYFESVNALSKKYESTNKWRNLRKLSMDCLQKDGENHSCQKFLCLADIELAEEYNAKGNWQAAIRQLNHANDYCVATSMTYEPMKYAYDQWYAEVSQKGPGVLKFYVDFSRVQTLSKYIIHSQ